MRGAGTAPSLKGSRFSTLTTRTISWSAWRRPRASCMTAIGCCTTPWWWLRASKPMPVSTYLLATNLDRTEVAQAFVAPETVSFWRLPGLASQTARAGLDPTAYQLKYQELLARPLTLASMVLVAACFSLRFFRMGGIEYMVSGGIIAGFVLYVATKVVSDLGGAGFLSTVRCRLGAWHRRLLVWRVCAAATRGWLMGFAVSFSFESIPRPARRARAARAGLLALAVAWLAVWGHLIAVPAAAQTQPATANSTQSQAAGQARHRRRRAHLRQRQEYGNRRRARFSSSIKAACSRPIRSSTSGPSKRVYAEGHAKMTDEHGNVFYGTPVRAQRRFSRRVHRQRPGSDKRQDALHLAARRAFDRRHHRAAERRIYRLRAVQGPSGTAAVLAGAGDQDHRKPTDPHDLL